MFTTTFQNKLQISGEVGCCLLEHWIVKGLDSLWQNLDWWIGGLFFKVGTTVDCFNASSCFSLLASTSSTDWAMKMKQILLLVLLFSKSFAFQAIDTGLGRKDPVRNQDLIKDFGSLMLLGEDNNTPTLPSNFTICSSISTADAKVPAAFFQLLGETNEAWISVSVLFGDKTKKIHVIKVMVSWLLSSSHTQNYGQYGHHKIM